MNDHPARKFDWETARENCYAATRAGLDANLVWRTTDTEELVSGLFDVAIAGLGRHAMTRADAEAKIAPIRERVRQGRTPAT